MRCCCEEYLCKVLSVTGNKSATCFDDNERKLAKLDTPEYLSYNFSAFKDLKEFLETLDSYFRIDKNDFDLKFSELPKSIQPFLIENNFKNEINRANENSATLKSFRKQFFQWFSAFRIIRYLNIIHESYYSKNDVKIEAKKLLQEMDIKWLNEKTDLLEIYRKIDRMDMQDRK